MLPVAVIGVLLGNVYNVVRLIYEPLKEYLPGNSALGLTVVFLIAVAILLVLCFISGLAAQRAIGRKLSHIGGGIYTSVESGGTTTIRNSTLSGNSAVSMGGGIFSNQPGTTNLTSSIVARNTAAYAPHLRISVVTVTTSLIGDNSFSGLSEAQPPTPDVNGNFVGTTASPIDPLLDPLADNGGPTETMALLPGSPAIDAGDPAAVAGQNGVPEFDQRGAGFPRVQEGRIDIGAYELQTASIAGRHVFYNNSAFDDPDGNGPLTGEGAGESDDNAIATDKQALLPGQQATFLNYTSYSRGINGVMVDVAGLANPSAITAADFAFATGNDNNPAGWSAAPTPASVTVREIEPGVHRITIIWEDDDPFTPETEAGAISKTWLQVTVLANAHTGLVAPDVHYWGNATGDIGDFNDNTIVNASDEIGARNNQNNMLTPADVENVYDFNRDTIINATDQIIARMLEIGQTFRAVISARTV